jgi:hypothetical protein
VCAPNGKEMLECKAQLKIRSGCASFAALQHTVRKPIQVRMTLRMSIVVEVAAQATRPAVVVCAALLCNAARHVRARESFLPNVEGPP